MTTMGLRGVLAAAFLLSSGMLTGMASPPGDPLAGEALVPDSEAVESSTELSLLSRIKLRSCEVSLGASRRDAAYERRAQCQDRIASSR
jgi:hypothetical protein